MLKIIIGMVFGFLIAGWVVEEYFNDRIVINEVTNIKELDGVNPSELLVHEKLSLYCGSLYTEYIKECTK